MPSLRRPFAGPAFAAPAAVLGASSPWTGRALVSSRAPPPLRARVLLAPPRRRSCVVASSSSSAPGRSDDGSRDSEFDISDLPRPSDSEGEGEVGERNELFEFVKTVPPPEMVARFAGAAPEVVQNAIRETIVSMLGSLPAKAFSPSVTTVSANLVQLLHSSLISGYMFRNAAYRLELTRNISGVGSSGLPALPGGEKPPEIVGGVAVFKGEDGKEVTVPVEEYVSELREQVDGLRKDLLRERKGGNELLSFISTLEKENLEALTNNAGPEVVDAMKKVVAAVVEGQGIPLQPDAVVDSSSAELGQLLFYLMVSGFFLREAEVRVELQRSLGGDGTINLSNLLEGDGNASDSSSDFSTDSEDEDPPLAGGAA